MPAIDTKMPKTFVLLLAEWNLRNLEDFRTFKFTQDVHNLGLAYAKRMYMFDAITRHPTGATLEEKARELDTLRLVQDAKKDRTMPGYHRVLKAADDSIIRRASKRPRNPVSPDRQPREAPPPVNNARGGRGGRGRGGGGGRGRGRGPHVLGDNGRWIPARRYMEGVRRNELPAWESTTRTSGHRHFR